MRSGYHIQGQIRSPSAIATAKHVVRLRYLRGCCPDVLGPRGRDNIHKLECLLTMSYCCDSPFSQVTRTPLFRENDDETSSLQDLSTGGPVIGETEQNVCHHLLWYLHCCKYIS